MFEVSGRSRSTAKELSTSSRRFIRLDWFQSLKQKPKTEDQFEKGHRKIEPPVINDFVEVRENEKNESTDDTPRGRDDTEESQSSRDVVRLEPKVGANSRGQSKERQADIIVIEIRAEM